ncbi:THO complex subunit 4-A-like [Brevipalpus obovatus]|uniref:THO complex subunit 4-A-like n=1 Tax=Brevipalpus obovatus TaxID=246614 RepID=UPI003D9E7E0E
MAERIDMSLDQIIKLDKISTRGRGGARRGIGTRVASSRGGFSSGGQQQQARRGGAMRVQMNRSSVRPAPYQRDQGKWQHDMFNDNTSRGRIGGGGYSGGGGSSGTGHLMISNLDYSVNDKDIKELFAEYGQIRKAGVHYDKAGRSLGTAEVIFQNRSSAQQAMNRYNDVLLDGRPMKISMVSSSSDNSSRRIGGGGGNDYRPPPMARSNRGSFRGGNSMGRGRGRISQTARRGPRKANITAEELDADLDAYVNK